MPKRRRGRFLLKFIPLLYSFSFVVVVVVDVGLVFVVSQFVLRMDGTVSSNYQICFIDTGMKRNHSYYTIQSFNNFKI